uniref:hypothetical protein n=1 Tax=Klebsiella sp. TaxID=576 RepID=UPI0025892D5F|nr:hypothetical protein [Klebsiella sp.]
MDNNTYHTDILAVTDKDVVDWCEQHLPQSLTTEMLINILDNTREHTDDEIFYAYFLYCWSFLSKIFLSNSNYQFRSFSYTNKLIKINNITLNVNLLKNHPSIFLYYIVLATQEALLTISNFIIPINAVSLMPYVGKIQNMMSIIDSISSKKMQNQLFLSFIPYSLISYIEKDKVEKLNIDVSNLERQLNDIVNDPQWSEIRLFLNDNKKLKDDIDRQNDLIAQIESYDNKINNLKSEYNFISLSKAFNSMRKIKTKELKNVNIIFYLIILALLSTPAGLLFFNIFGNPEKFNGWNKLFYFLPIATIELILIYLLRLFYIQKNSIMAQLLQIDFRLSICEFIKNYIEDRSENSGDKDTWSAFEALIFSPIQLREDKIPSVLDGADSVAEFINKALKSKNIPS